MTDEERVAALEKTVREFTLTTNQPNSIGGGFGELEKGVSIEERISHLERAHDNFRIVGGANTTVEGSLKTGYAICSTCPQESQGTGTGINPSPVINGACCIDGECSITTESACISAGGEYQGDNTDCDPNPCADGACCDIEGDCSIQTSDDCFDAGGVYLGDGTTCDGVDCSCCPWFQLNGWTTVKVSGSITGCPLAGTITFPEETWTLIPGASPILHEFTLFGCGVTAGNSNHLCNLEVTPWFRVGKHTDLPPCSGSAGFSYLIVDWDGECDTRVRLAGVAASCNTSGDVWSTINSFNHDISSGVLSVTLEGPNSIFFTWNVTLEP